MIKMSVKVTKNCIKSLVAKGVDASDIVVLTPTVSLNTDYLQSLPKNGTSHTELTSSSAENWFVSFLECIEITEAELETMAMESGRLAKGRLAI